MRERCFMVAPALTMAEKEPPRITTRGDASIFETSFVKSKTAPRQQRACALADSAHESPRAYASGGRSRGLQRVFAKLMGTENLTGRIVSCSDVFPRQGQLLRELSPALPLRVQRQGGPRPPQALGG